MIDIRSHKTGISLIWLLIMIVLVGAVAALFVARLREARRDARRIACQGNLKQVSIVLRMYADAHDGYHPPLSEEPGRIMFNPEDLFPEYMADVRVMICPNLSQEGTLSKAPASAAVDDHSYYYLSHIVTSETEGLAFIEAYRERAGEGRGLDEDLQVPKGQGNNGSDVLYRFEFSQVPVDYVEWEDADTHFVRVKENSDERLSIAYARIPIMVERPENHASLGGGNVVFADGHVEFIKHGDRFPMIPSFLEGLNLLDNF